MAAITRMACDVGSLTSSMSRVSLRRNAPTDRPSTPFLPDIASSSQVLAGRSFHHLSRASSGASVPSRQQSTIRAARGAGVDPIAGPFLQPGPVPKYYGTGRRKSATARVMILEGTGRLMINSRPGDEYLQGDPVLVSSVRAPLVGLGLESRYDVIVKAAGGGVSGQAGAIVLGLARALVEANAGHRMALKKQGMLTRDSRRVERKKAGLHKARKAPQFSKR